jgi:ABC-type multidrug transport system fused ATPase/permease subunit
MEAGQLFSFVIYSGFIAGNIASMAWFYTRLQRTIGAAENLLLILDDLRKISKKIINLIMNLF